MENENKNFEGFLGEVSGGESSKGQGMHMDPSIASLFQAFSLSMQQQQSNDRKEALATKALQAVVNKIDQFDGRNISRYLRCYVREMELNRVSEKKMLALFGLATIPEIRDHITSITDRCGNSWEDFSHALKDEYFLEDADRVTKKLFLGWIERPNKNLQAIELLREFERQYSQLSKVEKLTLESNKVDLFLQEPLLEDKEEDEGLTTKWKNVEDAVGLLTKKERRKDRSNISKPVQAPKAPVRTTPPTMLTVQPSTSLSKKAVMGMEEIIRGMRDLQIKLARLEENTSINNSKNVSKQGYVQRCIWCDDASHTRKDYGKIALKDREDLLQTNFGKGGMRALVQDYLKGHETVARESASYGARVDDEIGGSTKTSEFWASPVSTMQEGKLPREALLRTTAIIRGRTGWEDPVESLSVHAYIAKSQHEALMEEKRRGNFDDTREGNSFKRQTRGDKAREAASQELPRDYGGTKEEVLSRDEGAFDASFICILENGNIMYKKVEDFKRKERKRLYDIEGQLCKIGTLQDDERILGVYEENGLEDSLELITSIGLGDNDKIIEIHSREVYTMLESFQAPEVTVETRYKTADKKVKPVAGPLPEDSKEQMGEASKEASLRDPMSFGH
uniref:Predicted protein n=1 Tax=Physcomitrium patens TaxID=3218 RepID=A9TUZ1_PHYPA